MKAQRVGVLMGGLSSEREVSLSTGAGVLAALRERGYDCEAIDWKPGTSLPELLARSAPTVVWNALHGTYGEDGAVQGLLTCMGIPYTGSGILASAAAMDKVASKQLFDTSGIPTAPWQILAPDAPLSAIELELPVAIKPALEGSSVGVSLVFAEADLGAAVELARAHRGATLIERYIDGAEVCTGILDERVLGSVQVVPAEGFYDYQAKYQRDDTRYLVPPPLDAGVLERAETICLAAHRALGCEGYSRVDLLIDDAGEIFVLEVNTLPGMTDHSLLPKVAAHAGLDYADLCEQILRLALAG